MLYFISLLYMDPITKRETHRLACLKYYNRNREAILEQRKAKRIAQNDIIQASSSVTDKKRG